MFEEIKNRDAWSTIRGYVYQVDLTISRWLDLKDNQILELERGEDIDIINSDISKTRISRELEQIKYREATISLNQDLVFDLILNFYTHRKNNPSQELLFRYVTNSNYCTERPAIIPDGKSGIEVWIEIYNSKGISDKMNYLQNIKSHLLRKTDERLKKLKDSEVETEKDLKEFHDFLNDDINLFNLIKRFEWSFNNVEYDQLSEQIKKSLLEYKYVPNLNTTRILYSRLFLYVFKLLCKDSIKTLTKPELIDQVSLPELNSSDNKYLTFINDLLKNIEDRLSELELKTKNNLSDISILFEDIHNIKASDTVFQYRLANISSTPPSLIKNGTYRKSKVKEILELFNKFCWINFQGINGTGKSQLASLICNETHNFFWLDLRAYNQSIEKSTLLIETFLSEISNCNMIPNRKNWIADVFQSLPSDTLIVLNDLPRIEEGSPLFELLILITNEIVSTKCRLLTTSNFKIRGGLLMSTSTNAFTEYYDFEFKDEEIVEYCINNGSDPKIVDYVSLIAAKSLRNPRIVTAIIYHLKSINWGKEIEDLFDIIFSREFSEDLTKDAQLLIKKYIPDNSRELLYRLSLIHWKFEFKEINSISNIEEKIIHPNERLQDIVDIWIQQNNESYSISPLIYDIGKKNLSPEIIPKIYIAYAKSILESKRLDQLSATRVILSFISGHDYNNAGLILLDVYKSAETKEEVDAIEKWGYLGFWASIDIPKEMDLFIRVLIRNEQIRLYNFVGRDDQNLFNWLDMYILENQISTTGKALIHSIYLLKFNGKDLSNYWCHFNDLLLIWNDLEESFKKAVTIEVFASLLWSPIQYITLKKDINQWLNFISKLEDRFAVHFFDSEISQTAITILCNKIVKAENSKDERDRNWENTYNRLNILFQYFNSNHHDILTAVVLKEMIGLEFSVFNNPTKAEGNTIKFAGQFSNDEAKYLLYENIGKLYYNKNNTQKSSDWLFRAIEIGCTNQSNFVETLIYSASSISEQDTKKAVELCEKAVELAKNRIDYTEFDFIQVIGELGIAYWLNGDFISSFNSFENVVNRLLSVKDKDFGTIWIRLLMWSGHALGYIAASACKEEAPKFTSDGGDYFKPYQGLYSFNNKDLTDLYFEKNLPAIMAHLARFAEGINDISKAYYWALQAFDTARKNGDQQVFIMISAVCNQYSLINYKIEEAFESFLLFSAVSTHLKGNLQERHASLKELNLAEILANKSTENWKSAEDSTVTFAIVPIFIMVLSSYLENSKEKDDRFNRYCKLIEDYTSNAADKHLWDEVLELSKRIISNEISTIELIDRADTFGNRDQKNLQTICLLGLIFNTDDENLMLIQIINIFPYLLKIFGTIRSVVKFVLIPFVKNRCLHIIKNLYMGNKEELDLIVKQIEEIDPTNINAIQLIIQPVVRELEIRLPENRSSWLYDFKEI